MGFKTIFVFKDVPNNSYLYCTTEFFLHVKKIFVILGVKGETIIRHIFKNEYGFESHIIV
jgi:hypothetical protein